MSSLALRAGFVLLFLFTTFLTQAQKLNFSQQSMNELGRTIGFCWGQQHSLDYLKKRHPNLITEINKAEKEFNLAFGQAQKEMISDFEGVAPFSYEEFITQLIANTPKDQLEVETTEDEAQHFIDIVLNRARKGPEESPVRETLLYYQFRKHPVEELRRNYKQSYSTSGHHKAHGLNLEMELPVSWKKDEGNRPHIVNKFKSRNGHGTEMFMIIINNLQLDSDSQLSQKEVDEIYSESLGQTLAKELNGNLLSYKNIVLDRQKAGMLVVESVQQRMDLSIKMQFIILYTMYKGKLIMLQGGVSVPIEKGDELNQIYQHFYPLFYQVGNSFRIMDQY